MVRLIVSRLLNNISGIGLAIAHAQCYRTLYSITVVSTQINGCFSSKDWDNNGAITPCTSLLLGPPAPGLAFAGSGHPRSPIHRATKYAPSNVVHIPPELQAMVDLVAASVAHSDQEGGHLATLRE